MNKGDESRSPATASSGRVERDPTVIRDQAYNLSLFAVTAAVSLVMVRLVTTYLSPDDYGQYRYVLSVMALAAISTLPGITKTLSGYIAQGHHGNVSTTTRLSMKFGLAGLLFLAGFSVYTAIREPPPVGTLFLAATLLFLPYTVMQRYSQILMGLRRFADYFWLRSCSLIVLLVGAYVVLVVLDGGILMFGVTQLVLQTFLSTAWYLYAQRRLSNNRVDPESNRHIAIVTSVGLGTQLLAPGVELLVAFALGRAELALLVVARRLSRQATDVIKPITRPISIKLTQGGKLEHTRALFRLIPLAFAAGGILYFLFFFAIEWFGPLIVADAYTESLRYAKAFGLVIILSPAYTLVSANVIFEKSNRAYAISSLSEQALRFLGYLIFAPSYGIIAIALVDVGTMSLQFLYLIFTLRSQLAQVEYPRSRED